MSDDDCPPLEDMTSHMERLQKMRGKPFAVEQVEEVRLGAKPAVTQIKPTESEEAKEPAKP